MLLRTADPGCAEPVELPATNPQAIKRAMETGGERGDGVRNLLEDLGKGRISMTDEQAFEVGRNLDHARFRRLRERAASVDPVPAAHRDGRRAAAGLDSAQHQQVLRVRSATGQFVRALRRRAGQHRLHRVLAQRDGRAGPSDGTTISPRGSCGRSTSLAKSPVPTRSTHWASASAARCSVARLP